MNKSEKTCFFFEEKYINLTLADSEEVFIASILTCSFDFLFSVLTCAGNFLIVFAIAKSEDLRSPSFILLGCLAATDLFVGFVCQPISAARKIAELRENLTAFCTLKILHFVSGWITSGISLFTLAAVSVDRVLCLILHLRYKAIVTVPRTWIATSVLWMFSIAFVVVRFWMSNVWDLIVMAVMFLVFLVITTCTITIFQIVRRHQGQIWVHHVRANIAANTVNVLKCKKSAVTVLYIYGLFLIVYLPFFVVLIIDVFIGYTRTVKIAYYYAVTFIFINSCLNPFVYCWRIREIRRAVKNILTRR